MPASGDAAGPLLSLREEIDRLFDEVGSGFWRPLSRRMQTATPGLRAWASAPAVEVADCDGEYRVTAELPGMGPHDVELRLSEGMLTIRGSKSEERKEEKADYLVAERRYGAFQRSLPLPPGVDADAISAQHKDGVLTITLPKTAEARQKERRIEVTAA